VISAHRSILVLHVHLVEASKFVVRKERGGDIGIIQSIPDRGSLRASPSNPNLGLVSDWPLRIGPNAGLYKRVSMSAMSAPHLQPAGHL